MPPRLVPRINRNSVDVRKSSAYKNLFAYFSQRSLGTKIGVCLMGLSIFSGYWYFRSFTQPSFLFNSFGFIEAFSASIFGSLALLTPRFLFAEHAKGIIEFSTPEKNKNTTKPLSFLLTAFLAQSRLFIITYFLAFSLVILGYLSLHYFMNEMSNFHLAAYLLKSMVLLAILFTTMVMMMHVDGETRWTTKRKPSSL